jgi:hypothetical protein
MPSSSSQRSRPALVTPPPPVRWRVWYLADQPGWAIGWLLVLAVVWALVVWVTGRGYLGWLAVGVLVVGSWRLWTPVRYELSPEGIQQAIWGFRWTIAWKAIGRYEPTDSGVWLFPHSPTPSGKQARGMYLPWAEYRQQVLSHLQYHLGPGPEKTEGT